MGTKEKGKKNILSFANELIKEIDSVTNCALPVAKDRTEEYAALEGSYTDAGGKKLVVTQKNNILYFVWEGRDTRSFFHLYKDAPDYFSSTAMNILFVRNENGSSPNSAVEKAWCQYRGESFWVIKEK